MYATPDQCSETIEAIDALIPSEQHRLPYHPYRSGVLYEPPEPRFGETRSGAHFYDGFSSFVPRNWTVRIHEPYTYTERGSIKARKVRKLALPFLWDPRISIAEFDTYGLDMYDADQESRWDNTRWEVLQLASADHLGIFMTSPFFASLKAPHRMLAAIQAGHIALDHTEKNALLRRKTHNTASPDRVSYAATRSLRVTEQGAEYVLGVLAATLRKSNEISETI